MFGLTQEKTNEYITYALTALFGLAPMIGFGSLMLEGPIILRTAPEGWALSTQSSIISHASMVAPILYTFYQRYAKRKIKDSNAIIAILVLGICTLIAAIITVEKTIYVAGAERSVPYFVISFLFAVMGSLGSVLFLPYMGRFLERNMLVFMFGEAMGGFIPGLVSLFQGSGGDSQCILTNTTDGNQELVKYNPPPNFSLQVFLGISVVIVVIGLISFIFLDNLELCKTQYAKAEIAAGNDYTYKNSEKDENGDEGAELVSNTVYYTLLTLNALSVVTMSMVGSVSAYVYMPYGQEIYHLQSSITLALNPVTIGIGLFFRNKRLDVIIPLYIISFVMGCYILTLAFLSPYPPFAGTSFGGIHIISIQILKMAIGAYIRMSSTTVLRAQGGRSLVWLGVISQVGGTLAVFVSFLLTVVFDLFTSTPTDC